MKETFTPIVFGTDGWRSIIAEEFTMVNVRRVADALARVLPPHSHVVVGYDHRFLSDQFASDAAGVLSHHKHHVTLLNTPTTSPALSFSVRTQRARAGVMITASHNPATFNGFKVKSSAGSSADTAFTKELEEAVSNEIVPSYPLEKMKEFSPDKAYLQFLVSKLDKKFWRQKSKVGVVLDGMHGYGGVMWEKLADMLGIKAAVIRQNRDPLYGGVAPEPIEKNLAALTEAIKKNKAGLGLAVDGDGDRLGVVDDAGRYVTPHQVFSLILLHLLENRKMNKGKVVQSASLGYTSERIAKKFGLDFVEVPVGFKYVVQEMEKGKVLWGGEESGGYGVLAWAPERDGLLSGLLLLEMCLAKGQPLSAIVNDMESRFGKSVYLRHDYPVRSAIADKKKWAEILSAKITGKIAGTKIKEIRTLDGLKIILEGDAWLLLRPSGTEPLLRTYAESESLAKTQQLLAKAQEIATMRAS